MEYVDPRYECDAPTFVDFTQLTETNYQYDDNADEWFDKKNTPKNLEGEVIESVCEEASTRDECAVGESSKPPEIKVEDEAMDVLPLARENSDTESMNSETKLEQENTENNCLGEKAEDMIQSELEDTPSEVMVGSEEELCPVSMNPASHVIPPAMKGTNTDKMMEEFYNAKWKGTRSPRAAAKKANNNIHEILAGFRVPKSSNPQEENNEPKKQSKSTEELQMEEIKRLQAEAKKKLRRSRRSYHRLAKVSGPMHAIKGSRPPTEPKEFNFSKVAAGSATAAAARCQPGSSGEAINPRSFAETLRSGNVSRSYDSTTASRKPPTPDSTKPKPFKFELDKRPGLRSLVTNNTEMPMAEFIAKFQNSTPPRFRTTPVLPKASKGGSSSSNSNNSDGTQYSLGSHVTLPKTPNLATRHRKRPVTQKSAMEIEEEEATKMKQYKFKANPLNASIMNKGGLYGVPRLKNNHTATKAVSPALATKRLADKRRALHEEEEEELNSQHEADDRKFLAQPMPDFSQVKGLPAKRSRPLTHADSPMIMKRRRLNTATKEDEKEEEDGDRKSRVIKANPVPDFEKVFVPQYPQRCLIPQPFSFEERDKNKQTFAEKLLCQEQKPPFKAQPFPNFSYQPLKLNPTITQPEPFDLHTEIRGEHHMQNFKEQVEKQLEQTRKEAEFKAKDDVSYLYAKPFVPEKSTKPLVHVDNVVLYSEQRSSQRAKYEAEKQARSHLLEVENLQRRALREAKDAKELVKYRRSLVHRAQPVGQYAPIIIKPSDRPVTQPISPQLETERVLRSRSGSNV